MSTMLPPTNAYDVRPPLPYTARKAEIVNARKVTDGSYQVMMDLGDGKPKWSNRKDALRYISAHEFDLAKAQVDNGVENKSPEMQEHETTDRRRSDRLKRGVMATSAEPHEPNGAFHMHTEGAMPDLFGAVNGGSGRSNSGHRELKHTMKEQGQKDHFATESPSPPKGRVQGKRARFASLEVDDDQPLKKAEAQAHMSNGGPVQVKPGILRSSKKKMADEEDVPRNALPKRGLFFAPVVDPAPNTRNSKRQRRPTEKAVASALEGSQSKAKDKGRDDPAPRRNKRKVAEVEDRGPTSSPPSPLTGASSTDSGTKTPGLKRQCSGTETSNSTLPQTEEHLQERSAVSRVGINFDESDSETISNPTSADSDGEDPIYKAASEAERGAYNLVALSWESYKRKASTMGPTEPIVGWSREAHGRPWEQ